jgi:hypothetical protein
MHRLQDDSRIVLGYARVPSVSRLTPDFALQRPPAPCARQLFALALERLHLSEHPRVRCGVLGGADGAIADVLGEVPDVLEDVCLGHARDRLNHPGREQASEVHNECEASDTARGRESEREGATSERDPREEPGSGRVSQA